MTRRTRRRGFSLVELLATLPVWFAVMTAGYLLVTGTEGLGNREGTRRQQDARIRDLVRRVQEDAGYAAQAEIQDAQDSPQLILRRPDGTVTYAAAPGRVTRTQQPADGPATQYEWALDSTQLNFQLEKPGPGSPIIWLRFTTQLSFDRGPDLTRQLSAAATVGRGGAR